jgi:ribose transport system ATP-binding protein
VTPPLLELAGITKTFGGVMALHDVGFSLRPGEIHGLVGENGAGKSTLMKIIAGVHADYQGEMHLDGQRVHFASPRDARAAGIGMVHQELSAVRDLSVAENVHLGTQPINRFGLIDWRAMRRTAASSFWTSRPRRCRRRRSSGCSRCCGGCARRAAASCSSRTFSTTYWRSANA